MHEQGLGHFYEILLLLAGAVLVVTIFRMLRLSPVLGYLVAGAGLGPYGFGFISNPETTRGIAEFGVVFLLFLIGLELSFARLRTMRSLVFGVGTAQVLLSAGVIGLIAIWAYERSPQAALIVGGGLALSSTAVVLQVITESGMRAAQVGRISLAVLILQDLAVVPLLVLVPLLAEDSGSIAAALANAGLRAAVALALLFIAGRLLLRPIFRVIASFKIPELFSATTLLIVLGISWLTYQAGLSLALGAFMAGLLMAETEYQHQVEADITPYKGLFMGLFFMVVGMSVDLHFFMAQWKQIILLSLALVAVKAVIMAGLFRLSGMAKGTSIHAALLLSQGGEFAFVLFSLATDEGLLARESLQLLMVVIAVTMALTPALSMLGRWLASHVEGVALPSPQTRAEETLDCGGHVVIAGFGRMGQLIGRLLTAEGIPYIALDYDPQAVAEGRAKGKPVYYGDASRMDVLDLVGIRRARCVVITLKQEFVTERLVQSVRRISADMPLIARAVDIESARRIEIKGATIAVPEVFEGALQLGVALLKTLDIPTHEVIRITDVFRAKGYALAHGEEAKS